MAKTVVVVQKEHGCQVLINPTPDKYEHLKHLVNPDMSRVLGTSPHMWSIRFGFLVLASDNTVSARELALHPERKEVEKVKRSYTKVIICGILIAIAVATLRYYHIV